MIEIKKLIPQVYNQSRDFGVFTGLMQILMNEVDQRSRILLDLPDESILLRKVKAYPQVKEYFRKLLKNKGNIMSILYAISLSSGQPISFEEEEDYLSENDPNYKEWGDGYYLDRTNIGENIDKSQLVYYEEFGEGQQHKLYINIKDSDQINQNLLKSLFFYILPVNTKVFIQPI